MATQYLPPVPPSDVIYNQHHLAGRTRQRQHEVVSTQTSGIFNKLRGLFGGRSAPPQIDADPTPVRQVLYPNIEDHWGPLLSGNGRPLGRPGRLSIDESEDAMGILLGLAINAVSDGDRHVFFSNSRGWLPLFPQLHADWSQRSLAAVFFGIGLGASFTPWARAKLADHERKLADIADSNMFPVLRAARESIIRQQKKLLHTLDDYASDVIVVAPAILPMTPDLLEMLRTERGKIWSLG